MPPDLYSSLAFCYDFITASFLEGPRREAANLCLRRGFRRILDMGCGTGKHVEMLRGSGIEAFGLDASRAMLACAPKTLPLVQADAARPPFRANSFGAVFFSLVLHESDAEPTALLRSAFRLAPFLVVLEWRMPERNLDYPLRFWVPFIERLAGRRHYARYREYMMGGGLHGLAQRANARVIEEIPLRANSLVLAVLENISPETTNG